MSNCRLEQDTFSNAMGIRSYEALSYTWGSPGTLSARFPRRFITLNGAKFEVWENLFQALHYLALKSKERVLWIDAICIDQNDINERNHQLGRSSIGAGKAFRVVHECAGYINRIESIDGLRLNGRGSIELPKCLRYTTGYWQVRELCERDYWSRVWIIQEMGLGSKIQVVCCNHTLCWDSFSQVLMRLPEKEQPTGFACEWRKTLPAMLESVRDHEPPPTLQNLLLKFRTSLRKVPHDKIYGFSGLASDWAKSGIQIDYSKPLLQLHGEVLSFYCVEFGDSDARLLFDSQLLQFSWFLWNQLATSRPDLALVREFATSNQCFLQVTNDQTFQQVAAAVRSTFIKVGVN